MRRAVLLYVFLILWSQIAVAQSVITVEINESGNALWIMEKQLSLTKSELNEWEATMKTGQNISRYKDIEDLNETFQRFARSSRNFTNRSMEVGEFNISNVTYDTIKTLSDGFGVIRYSFWWKNFSYTNLSKIYVGDAFSEEMVLSSDNVLIIKIPEGYDVQNATPAFDNRDGNRLIWSGTLYRNLSRGEPSLVLNHTNATGGAEVTDETMPGIESLSLMVIIGILIILLSGSVLIFWKKGRSRDLTQVPGNDSAMTDEIDTALTSLPDMTKEILGYEDMIMQFLIKSGGQAFQSEIVRQSGLSKSKISIVLAQMKEEGRIIKIRRGKENIIRMVNKTENE